MPTRRAPSADRASFYRRLPVGVQWGLPFGVAILVVAVITIFVSSHQSQDGAEATISAQQLKLENQEAEATMRKQQKPHTAKLSIDGKPARTLEKVVRTWTDRQVKLGQMGGPVTGVRCSPAPGPGSSSQRLTMKCLVKASQVSYDFRGVVQPKLGTVTYCQKIEYAPQYGGKLVPLSPACI